MDSTASRRTENAVHVRMSDARMAALITIFARGIHPTGHDEGRIEMLISTTVPDGALYAFGNAMAGGDIQARNSLVECTIKTNGKVRMIGTQCSVVGGTIKLRHGVETLNLGSDVGDKTELEKLHARIVVRGTLYPGVVLENRPDRKGS